MAWRMAKSVVRGEIDNRQKGRVTGRIWLLGREDPVQLKLSGNGLEDVAGRLLTFVNPQPAAGDVLDLAPLQEGTVGDVTSSRKVFALDCTVEEAMKLATEEKEVPKHLANCFYLEWFSQANGRVVIESTEFQVALGEPFWTASPGELARQSDTNKQSFLAWMERLDAELASSEDATEGETETPVIPEDRPLNEFEWEKLFRESDRKTEKLGEIMDKYRGHPDADKLIAREMGWTWMEEAIEAQERGYIGGEDDHEDDSDLEPLEPNPLTEGRDWIRDEDGDVHHPLALKAFRLAMRMWHYADEMGLVRNEGRNEIVHQMVFQMQCASAKLAGALNGLAYDREVDHGFVIAGLKRAVTYLHASIQAGDQVMSAQLLPAVDLDRFRNELFGVREDILALMKEHREQLGAE